MTGAQDPGEGADMTFPGVWVPAAKCDRPLAG